MMSQKVMKQAGADVIDQLIVMAGNWVLLTDNPNSLSLEQLCDQSASLFHQLAQNDWPKFLFRYRYLNNSQDVS